MSLPSSLANIVGRGNVFSFWQNFTTWHKKGGGEGGGGHESYKGFFGKKLSQSPCISRRKKR